MNEKNLWNRIAGKEFSFSDADPWSWIRRHNIFKMAVLSKFIFRFKKISAKITAEFFYRN